LELRREDEEEVAVAMAATAVGRGGAEEERWVKAEEEQ